MWKSLLILFFVFNYIKNNTIEYSLKEIKEDKDFYTILIKLGNQSFEVQIDTTSCISWVPSTAAKSNITSYLNIQNYYKSKIPFDKQKNETDVKSDFSSSIK